MGVMDSPLAKPIPPGADQDAILHAVGEEITNRGFVIRKLISCLIGRDQALCGQ